ncbi:hypothetical protein HERIO_233 [Hepatospora eriocheir]|uniref:Uncharacterized protein n=1 Tax=Hepatospora eriocheir TaxID=1081669 RepID=A0A1X0QDR0_9MICR|nr:hypothetical protein HERIO_233 [Hepatospora eriocheir]
MNTNSELFKKIKNEMLNYVYNDQNNNLSFYSNQLSNTNDFIAIYKEIMFEIVDLAQNNNETTLIEFYKYVKMVYKLYIYCSNYIKKHNFIFSYRNKNDSIFMYWYKKAIDRLQTHIKDKIISEAESKVYEIKLKITSFNKNKGSVSMDMINDLKIIYSLVSEDEIMRILVDIENSLDVDFNTEEEYFNYIEANSVFDGYTDKLKEILQKNLRKKFYLKKFRHKPLLEIHSEDPQKSLFFFFILI